MLISPLTHVMSNIDEYFTLTLINFPISDLLHITGGDVNPPLYYLLLKGVSKFVNDLTILKIFSAIPYAILIIVSTVKIRKDHDWFTAGLFVLSVAVMSEFFTKFLLLRPYSWAVLFMVLAFIYFRDLVSDKINFKSLILFTVFSILGSYCHYYAVITTICLYIIFLVHRLKFSTDDYRYFLISAAIAIILYIPWISNLFKMALSHHNFITPDIIQTLSYFAFSGDTVFSIITLLIFAIITAIYLKSTKEENFYVLAGIGTYFGTIIIALIISLVNPILVQAALLPASSIMLLTIVIMISKLKDKMFLISLVLMILLLVSGFATLMVTSDSLYNESMTREEIFDNITSDNNSVVIINSPGTIMYFLDAFNGTDVYCLDLDYVYGENMNRTHEIFNFKDISQDDIRSFATNNSDKNIYLIGWNDPDTNLSVENILNEDELVISKVDTTNMTVEEDEYYYY